MSYCKYCDKVRKLDCLKNVKSNKDNRFLNLLFAKCDSNKTNKILINLTTTIFSHIKDILLITIT
jgi:hypothetical protein